MEEAFLKVFNNYFSTRLRLNGKANVIGTPDQDALLSEIPNRIQSYLNRRGIGHLYKVKASIGNGNIARVPWVGVFRRDVTENAENGYYIVLLFSEVMNSCYLSLNQGITAIEKLYTKKFALKKMRETSAKAFSYLESTPEEIRGPIDLSSTGDLGRAYESAAIVSFKYSLLNLPSESIFLSDLEILLRHYEVLYKTFGNSLNSLVSVSEAEFQQVVLEKAAQIDERARVGRLNSGLDPSLTAVLGSQGFLRSPVVAAEAISAAHFSCEIDPEHWTFTSKAKKHRYVEAHHLIPISHQDKFLVTLDIVENVVSLCATCHRMLHYGVEQERKPLLISLFKQRKGKLFSKSIDVEPLDFLRFYANGMVMED